MNRWCAIGVGAWVCGFGMAACGGSGGHAASQSQGASSTAVSQASSAHGGSSGANETSAHGTSTASSGTNDTPVLTAHCAALSQCCTEIPLNDLSNCNVAVDQDDDSTCYGYLSSYYGYGYCAAIAQDAGVPAYDAGSQDGGASDASRELTADGSPCGDPFNTLQTCQCVVADGGVGCASGGCTCEGVQACCLYSNYEICYYGQSDMNLSADEYACGGVVVPWP